MLLATFFCVALLHEAYAVPFGREIGFGLGDSLFHPTYLSNYSPRPTFPSVLGINYFNSGMSAVPGSSQVTVPSSSIITAPAENDLEQWNLNQFAGARTANIAAATPASTATANIAAISPLVSTTNLGIDTPLLQSLYSTPSVIFPCIDNYFNEKSVANAAAINAAKNAAKITATNFAATSPAVSTTNLALTSPNIHSFYSDSSFLYPSVESNINAINFANDGALNAAAINAANEVAKNRAAQIASVHSANDIAAKIAAINAAVESATKIAAVKAENDVAERSAAKIAVVNAVNDAAIRSATKIAAVKATNDAAVRSAAKIAAVKAANDAAVRSAAKIAVVNAANDVAIRSATKIAAVKAANDAAIKSAAEIAAVNAVNDAAIRSATKIAAVKAANDAAIKSAAEIAAVNAANDAAIRSATKIAAVKAANDAAVRSAVKIAAVNAANDAAIRSATKIAAVKAANNAAIKSAAEIAAVNAVNDAAIRSATKIAAVKAANDATIRSAAKIAAVNAANDAAVRSSAKIAAVKAANNDVVSAKIAAINTINDATTESSTNIAAGNMLATSPVVSTTNLALTSPLIRSFYWDPSIIYPSVESNINAINDLNVAGINVPNEVARQAARIASVQTANNVPTASPFVSTTNFDLTKRFIPGVYSTPTIIYPSIGTQTNVADTFAFDAANSAAVKSAAKIAAINAAARNAANAAVLNEATVRSAVNAANEAAIRSAVKVANINVAKHAAAISTANVIAENDAAAKIAAGLTAIKTANVGALTNVPKITIPTVSTTNFALSSPFVQGIYGSPTILYPSLEGDLKPVNVNTVNAADFAAINVANAAAAKSAVKKAAKEAALRSVGKIAVINAANDAAIKSTAKVDAINAANIAAAKGVANIATTSQLVPTTHLTLTDPVVNLYSTGSDLYSSLGDDIGIVNAANVAALSNAAHTASAYAGNAATALSAGDRAVITNPKLTAANIDTTIPITPTRFVQSIDYTNRQIDSINAARTAANVAAINGAYTSSYDNVARLAALKNAVAADYATSVPAVSVPVSGAASYIGSPNNYFNSAGYKSLISGNINLAPATKFGSPATIFSGDQLLQSVVDPSVTSVFSPFVRSVSYGSSVPTQVVRPVSRPIYQKLVSYPEISPYSPIMRSSLKQFVTPFERTVKPKLWYY